MKRLPAYGRQLLDALNMGREPIHGIAVWIDRPASTGGVCAPLAVFADTDPLTLDWSVCCARSVIVPHANEVVPRRLIATVSAIRAARPLRLLLLKEASPGFEFVVAAGGAAA